jgi:Concanavalin A-like lectin/glucanases superfamily/Bacterial Ig domain/PKD domain
MKTNINHSLIFLGVISTIAVLSIILISNPQIVYSKNPEVSYLDVNGTNSVSKFSVAAWFKTSNDYKSDAFIVSKPGDGGNMNYGIWMTNAEKIRGGFETSNGKPIYATSPLSYSDGKWHYAVVTFDGSVINLYVDGIQVATQSASGSPDKGGNEPVRVGADSKTLEDYFIGNVDEIRVWRVALTPDEVKDAYQGFFETKYLDLYLDFSKPIVSLNATNATSIANETATNATSTNATSTNATSIANQTATNATSTNATSSANQTATNATGIQESNITATNETGIQGANKTAVKEFNGQTNLITKNDTGNANGTNQNIESIKKPQTKNETGVTNETVVENQTSASKLSKENSLPKAFDQSVAVDQNSRIEITLAADDEDKDNLQFDITADPLRGSLDNFNKEKGTVTYTPQKDYSGDDKFSFRVSDNKGGQSEPANVDIQINTASQPSETRNTDTGASKSEEKLSNQTGTEQNTQTNSVQEPNQPPKADAGDDQYVKVSTQVKLDGGKSSDEDGKIVSYKWEQTDGPKVNIKKADGQTASFDVPDSAADSKLTFKLTVLDDKDASSSDDVTVQVGSEVPVQTDTNNQQTDTTNNKQTDTNNQQSNTEEQIKAAQNVPPKADAGGDQKVEVNSEAKLDGGKSSDEDGKIVSYKWERTDGPKVDLKNADKETATFDVPESAADSKLTFKLTVVDDKDASSSDDVNVDVGKISKDVSSTNDDSSTKDASNNNKGKSN